MEEYLNDYDNLFRTTQKMTDTLEKQVKANRDYTSQNEDRRGTITAKGAEVWGAT